MNRHPDTHDQDRRALIAARFREARRHAGRSRLEVGRAFGMDRASVADIELGQRSMRCEEVLDFADYLGVDVRWLLGDLDAEMVA